MPFVSGFLRAHKPGRPGHELPGEPPEIDEPEFPGNELPEPPPGVWPPPTIWHPIIPAPPETPPGAIWPPTGVARPPIDLPPAHPGGGPIVPPGSPEHPLPSPGKFWIVAGIPGLGWRYVCVDPSLTVGHPLPPVAQPKG